VQAVAGKDPAVVFGEGDVADPAQACLDRLPAVGLPVPPGSTHDLTAACELVLPALCSRWTLRSVSPPSCTVGSSSSDNAGPDNALMESAIGLFKTELIDRQHSWTGRKEVERETAAWVHWFNAERLHSAIDYRPPVEFEDLYRDTTTTAALAVA
jgi:hypothetical protein